MRPLARAPHGLAQALGMMLLAALLTPAPARAWNEEGHRTVALVADGRLSPRARAWVTETLRHHPHQVRDLSDASCWADDIRDLPDYHHGSWHYLNTPLFLDVPEQPLNVSGDILVALNTCTRIVKDRAAPPLERAVALAWIVHLVGDIHQPLHAVNAYSQALPEGDRGGGRLVVLLGQVATNLHVFWDSAGGLYWRGANHGRLHSVARALEVAYPVDESVEIRVPRQWATESYQLARDLAYPGVVAGEPLSPEYIARARDCSQQRLALAGYRLADYIERLSKANE